MVCLDFRDAQFDGIHRTPESTNSGLTHFDAEDDTTGTSPGVNAGLADPSETNSKEQNTPSLLKDEETLCKQSLDLVNNVQGLYRILDLISERGSNGLVDKVIIDQVSTGQFINELCPGTYKDMTKIDLKALDKVNVKPMGVYGSKSEIIHLLRSLKVVDDETARLLMIAQTEDSSTILPSLRAGLYALVITGASAPERQLFVIFWPEETTWDDNASSTVQRNRVTFMRYLTKITDQIMALISEDHSRALVWKDAHDADDADDSSSCSDDLEEDTSRLMELEVSKLIEQRENVSITEGIKIQDVHITAKPIPEEFSHACLPASQLQTRLIAGDTRQALMTARIVPMQQSSRCLSEMFRDLSQLERFLYKEDVSLHLCDSISRDAIIELKHGLSRRYPTAISAFDEREREIEAHINRERSEFLNFEQRAQADLSVALKEHFVQLVLNNHPKLDEIALRGKSNTDLPSHDQQGHCLAVLQNLFEKIPSLGRKLDEMALRNNVTVIRPECAEFATIASDHIFRHHHDLHSTEQKNICNEVASEVKSRISDALEVTRDSNSIDFFSKVDDIRNSWPALGALIKASRKNLEQDLNEKHASSRHQLLSDLRQLQLAEDKRPTIINLRELRSNGSSEKTYNVSGSRIDRKEASVEYTVSPLELTEDDLRLMRSDPAFVPKPKISQQGSFCFNIKFGEAISLIRLLPYDRCLVLVEGRDRNLEVYVGNVTDIAELISKKYPVKSIKRERVGERLSLTFNEEKRTLIICGVDVKKSLVQLLHYTFDERFGSLQARGGSTNITPGYRDESGNPVIPKITDIHFIGSSEEVALLESTGRLRFFWTATQRFRPGSTQLPFAPLTTFSTPDGSCFGAIHSGDNGLTLTMYHWQSMNAYSFEISDHFSSHSIASAFDERKNVHLFALNLGTSSCISKRICITSPMTTFELRKRRYETNSGSVKQLTAHNSLIDCHSEVWARFPVAAAIQRQAVIAKELRQKRSMRFVSCLQLPFRDYFEDMIRTFRNTAKKPTDSVLSDIAVLCDRSSDLDFKDAFGECSIYRAGEWIVDIFCLIPIHIAIARNNRFIPLKDGVWDTEFEKSLLGAEVWQVVDSLSFGWYESIFQSYMSTKNVRVVSSMGEQSVGKSYALIHLADTSFAGSAMRTTEGVWMAVTPTETDLIVSLDFEGIHSVERTAQEDTLLVLFNAAISNLVLFRNNFAFSRDISNLFQSFQSSSSILDPKQNQSLFQSGLAIIIKDVLDSDCAGVHAEFERQFHRIVQDEQDSNFITRLFHGGVTIIPWPVVESRKFYKLFSSLRKQLQAQESTYQSGACFLQKMKMLMAKVKVNDWSPLSQNMATYRAQSLLSLLPCALSFGATEVEPDVESLKNFDTNDEIESEDSNATFWVNKQGSHQKDQKTVLRELMLLWPNFHNRYQQRESDWVEQLCLHLHGLADRRVSHVLAWVDSNLSHFTRDTAAIQELRRDLDSGIEEVKRSVQLCKTQCERCHLLCLGAQFHEGAHDCLTNHACPLSCQFSDGHEDSQRPCCSIPAGHEGPHMCNVASHLCGQRCDLSEWRGCQRSCTKHARHSENQHLCSERHFCGQSCQLQNVEAHNRELYTCQETCVVAWDKVHDTHTCGAPCPFKCRLCGKRCASYDHFHGLQVGVNHLCSKQHKCEELCGSEGICSVETVPKEAKANFQGAHDQFQYTKYTQESKRLQCAIPIPPGSLTHSGAHVHSKYTDLFHYCDEKCPFCDYYCTYPKGHPQPRHSTSHGSMSRTRWATDGNLIELDGHKFGINDVGTPMLCSQICKSMERHVHIDYCRASGADTCNEDGILHIDTETEPYPERQKDWISHKLFWERSGFEDPYSRKEQDCFAKCDAICPGAEHERTDNPSYCIEPIFHPKVDLNTVQTGGYVSLDGHRFSCKNPATLLPSYHVIFVIDRSGSMDQNGVKPKTEDPVKLAKIVRTANNRLGAVYSSLHSFWLDRANAMNQARVEFRRDAYSTILFNRSATEVFSNDFRRSPEELLDEVLNYSADGGTDFSSALSLTEQVMTRHWSTERAPVVIFLSDGEDCVADHIVYGLCQKAVSQGHALSFHAVSFGQERSSGSLRHMVDIAKEVQDRAPRDLADTVVPSSYGTTMDAIKLTDMFLHISGLLRARAGLIR